MMKADLEEILKGLNKEQRIAATQTRGAVRLIAGAGSGKTHTLTKRVAYICASENVEPKRVLSVTFTNKAAKEMRERVAKLMNLSEDKFSMMTFHSLALEIVKDNLNKFGWTRLEIGNTSPNLLVPMFFKANPEIKAEFDKLDKEIQYEIKKSLIAKIRYVKSNGYYAKWLDKKERASLQLASVDVVYDEVLSYKRLADAKHTYTTSLKTFTKNQKEGKKGRKTVDDVVTDYKEWQSAKGNSSDGINTWVKGIVQLQKNKCSFDDMLNLAVYLLETYDDVREKWSNKYDFIQVDEFQDTDSKQLKLVKLLYERHGNLFVVGDPDQSIYLFRGAEPTLFNKLEEHIPNLKTIFMVSNYRSTDEIVKVSDEVIKLNKNRIAKQCQSIEGEGEKVRLLLHNTEQELVNHEVALIEEYIKNGRKPNEIAILYRSVADGTRELLINTLKSKGIPVVYEENKDIYYEFAWNICKYDYTKNKEYLMLAIELIIEEKNKFGNVFNAVDIDDVIKGLSNINLYSVIDTALDICAYLGLNDKESFDEVREKERNKAGKRIGNNIGYAWTKWNELSEEAKKIECEKEASLEDVVDNIDTTKGVSIMTMHKSKGLEFPIVFINGLNTAIFSNEKSYEEVEEEARLAYVGYSRAKEQLFLGHAKNVMQKIRDGRSFKNEEAPTEVHGILAQIMNNENVLQEIPDSKFEWDAKTIAENSLATYNATLSKYYSGKYTPLEYEGKIVGYRYTSVQNGELVGYQASIEDLEKYDCVPNNKYLTITITEPLTVRKIEDKHLYAFDEINNTIRIYDCKTETEIKKVFETSSASKFQVDIKDDAFLGELAKKAESRTPRETVIEKSKIEDKKKEKSEKKEKIFYQKVIDKDTGKQVGLRIIKDDKKIEMKMDEVKAKAEELKELLKDGEKKEDIKVTIKCDITYEQFVEINKALRDSKKKGIMNIPMLRITNNENWLLKVEDTKDINKFVTLKTDELVNWVRTKKVCLSNPSALVQWNKWKD